MRRILQWRTCLLNRGQNANEKKKISPTIPCVANTHTTWAQAKQSLPTKPPTLVNKYLEGKERLDKNLVVSRRHSRFTKPAMPCAPGEFHCFCGGKCATKRCICKQKATVCDIQCGCDNNKCTNK